MKAISSKRRPNVETSVRPSDGCPTHKMLSWSPMGTWAVVWCFAVSHDSNDHKQVSIPIVKPISILFASPTCPVVLKLRRMFWFLCLAASKSGDLHLGVNGLNYMHSSVICFCLFQMLSEWISFIDSYSRLETCLNTLFFWFSTLRFWTQFFDGSWSCKNSALDGLFWISTISAWARFRMIAIGSGKVYEIRAAIPTIQASNKFGESPQKSWFTSRFGVSMGRVHPKERCSWVWREGGATRQLCFTKAYWNAFFGFVLVKYKPVDIWYAFFSHLY